MVMVFTYMASWITLTHSLFCTHAHQCCVVWTAVGEQRGCLGNLKTGVSLFVCMRDHLNGVTRAHKTAVLPNASPTLSMFGLEGSGLNAV